jgi:hypothetical protein
MTRVGGMSKPGPARGAERRRVAWVRFRNRVRGSLPGKLTNFLPFLLQLPLLAAILLGGLAALAWEGLDLYQREGFAQARLARIDSAIDHARTTTGSPYCRAIFGSGPYYQPCAAGERHSLVQYSRAWNAGRRLPTISDHMIDCFERAQKEMGTSWHVAAVCAGADEPSPADTFSEG